jgi:hypothetical protein
MKLGGSLGNDPQKMKKLDIFRTVSPFSRVQFILLFSEITFIIGLVYNKPLAEFQVLLRELDLCSLEITGKYKHLTIIFRRGLQCKGGSMKSRST